MAIFRVWVFLTLSALLSSAYAADPDLIILASGQGASAASAVEDALREATQEAIGVYVSSQMEVKNDALVKDKQIAYSAGMVKRYRVLAQYRDSSGVYFAKIRAVVYGSKIDSLTATQGAQGQIDGPSLGQRILLERNELREKDALFNQAFDSFYAKLVNLSVTKVVAEPTRGGDVTLEMDVKAKISDSSREAFGKLLSVIAKSDSWASSGKDVILQNSWGMDSDKIDFGDPRLSERILSLCVAGAVMEVDLVAANGDLLATKSGAFNGWNLFRCGSPYAGAPDSTNLLVWGGHTEKLTVSFNLPVAEVSRLDHVRAFIEP